MDRRVTIVVDPDFAHLETTAEHGPVWQVETPHNRAAMEELWTRSKWPAAHLTSFKNELADPIAAALSILATVDLHHPDWTELRVLGALSPPPLDEVVEILGPVTLEERLEAVIIRRATAI